MITLPRTQLHVSSLSLGAMPFGSDIGEANSFAMMDRYLELGGNFIDTAAVYANWLPIEVSISEKTVGRWMKARGNRAEIVLGTKGAHPDLKTPHIPRMSPAEVESDLHDSLRYLQTDVIDLYWLHRDDPSRPAGEIVEMMNAFVRAGKIRYFGCSNWPLTRIRAAQEYARAHGLQGFAADQPMWSLAAVDIKRIGDDTLAGMTDETRAYEAANGVTAIPYSPTAHGLFHKMDRGMRAIDVMGDGRYDLPENARRLQRIRQLRDETALSITQIVLGYLVAQPCVTIPIIGPRSIAQLDDSMSAADVRLTPAQVAFLEQG
ncbi:MAG: aldo/keto reductase [Caldilineales bacterium]|nr:aldo/keto reductase [Caldilineales bacterium]